ncbi:hypothetical protein QYF36_009158 [Acer negundo]|nr:hypothetical protein QYF36_009158 [Acer negundo]
MQYLNYFSPERFYNEADIKNLDFICIDVGSKCSGLAITVVSQRSSYTIPFIDRAEGFEGDNFVLSPIEKFLKAERIVVCSTSVENEINAHICDPRHTKQTSRNAKLWIRNNLKELETVSSLRRAYQRYETTLQMHESKD